MRNWITRAGTGLLIAGVAAGCTDRQRNVATDSTGAAAPPPAASPAAPAGPGDWVTYNGTLSGERYSSLDQITTANVARLKRVCAFDTPDTVSLQSGILAVNGTLFFTAFNSTYAFDGATCTRKWTQTRPEPATYLKVNRGLGYSDGRLFRGTGDAVAG